MIRPEASFTERVGAVIADELKAAIRVDDRDRRCGLGRALLPRHDLCHPTGRV